MQLEYLELLPKFEALRTALDGVGAYRDSAIVNKTSWRYYLMVEKMCHGPREEDD